jgi:putative ABC transport system permease protein
MIKNYLKIAFRNFQKHKLFTFVNIFGLAMGFSICLLAIIYIYEAHNYDTFHKLGDRIYRITSAVEFENGEIEGFATTPYPLKTQIQHSFSFVENSTRIYTGIVGHHVTLQKENESTNIDIYFGGSAFVEPSFFEIFDFELLVGNEKTALSNPNTIVLSEAISKKFFGNENPIGKTIIFKEIGEFTVTGILQKNTEKSHLSYEVLISASSLEGLAKSGKFNLNLEAWRDFWTCGTYVVLKENADIETFKQGLAQIEKKHLQNLIFEKAPEGWTVQSFSFELQALKHISPSTGKRGEMGRVGAPLQGLLALAALAMVIMLSACFNYTNLSLIRSLSRAKEVGVRKVVGARRSQIFVQFLSESIIIAFGSLILGYVFLTLIEDLPQIRRMMEGVKVTFPIVLIFCLFALFIGLLAGGFPAWLLSAFQPVEVLKKLSNIKIFKGIALRNGLVVFQFLLSLIVVIVLFVLYKQNTFVATADYGFDKKNIINISLQYNDYQILANELSKDPRIESLSATSENLGYFPSGRETFRKDKTATEGISIDTYDVSPTFVKTMNLKLLAGTTFPPNLSDKNEQYVILDEAAAKRLGLGSPVEAVGQSVFLNDSVPLQVVGILKNFRYISLNNKSIGANMLAFRYRPKAFTYLNVKTTEGNMLAVNQSLKGIWKKLYPKQDYEAHFYEERFFQAHAHRDDLLFVAYLAAIALSIACLGLLAISSYIAETKVKEVGIRKVFGAEVRQIIWLLSKGLAKLLAIATIIALPIGYVIGEKIVQEYAVQVSFTFDILPLSVILVAFIGFAIILSQTYRTAQQNPATSLRSE